MTRRGKPPWGRGSTWDPFSLWGKNWLVWRIGRKHLRSVAHLARGRTLDIGCGSQPMRPVFEPQAGPIIGLDHPHRNGVRAHSIPHRAQVLGNALSLPFAEESFESALCLQVLEHVPEPEECLREAFRVLRPGGHLILTAPHIWAVHDAPHDYYRFTAHGLDHLFRKTGFEVVEIRPMAGGFVTAGTRLSYFLAHFDRWGLGILVRPAMLAAQGAAGLLDRIHCDTDETWNYLAVGRKPGSAGRARRA